MQKTLFGFVGFALFFILNACAIEGEALVGVWLTGDNEGSLRIDIKPWKGKFNGYLLDFQYVGSCDLGSQ